MPRAPDGRAFMPTPVTSSAPGKVILLGEHAVVFGEPAIAVAINKRTRVKVTDGEGDVSRVNGFPLSKQYHVHLALAVERLAPGEVVDLVTESQVVSAAGTGSSAALTVAVVHALLRRAGKLVPGDEETVAREAYEIEWLAQNGRGSPTDTSVATHGHGVIVAEEAFDELLWTVKKGPRRWRLHHLDLPPMTLVVGNTHERGRTMEQVAKVGRFVKQSGFGREIIRDLGVATRQGLVALASGDAIALGDAMDRAQNGLETLGVSTRKLERACAAARDAGALGAKLTGSGGGGSMIALVQGDPLPIAKAINRTGCSVFVTALGVEGVRAEDKR